MKDERRGDMRVDFGQDVLINDTMKVKALTISEEGLYVHTGRFFPVGTVIDLSLTLGKEKLMVKARVRHSQQGIGMGLIFLDLGDEDLERLRQYIKDRSCDITVPSNR